MQNGPLLVQTGRFDKSMRVRYRLRPWGISSRPSAMKCMARTLAQPAAHGFHLCNPRSSGSSVEVLMTLVC
jgi:hypothetical protein